MQQIHIDVLPSGVQTFMEMEPSPEKNYIYEKKVIGKTYPTSNLLKRDKDIFYSFCNVNIKRGNNDNYYPIRHKKRGFSFKDNKLSIWYGGRINDFPELYFLLVHHLGANWMCASLMPYITKGLIEKVLQKKITNPLDYCKAYLKANRIKCSPALFYKALRRGYIDKHRIMHQFSIAENIDNLLKRYLKEGKKGLYASTLLFDMENEASILNKKINYLWSEKRIEQEHQAWTAEIMQFDKASKSHEKLRWLQPFHDALLPGMRLLDTEWEVFQEGTQMAHCVYTSYWSSVAAKRYLVIAINNDKERVTLGINYNQQDKMIQFDQMYGKYNRPTSPELTTQVKQWINDVNQSDIFYRIDYSEQKLTYQNDVDGLNWTTYAAYMKQPVVSPPEYEIPVIPEDLPL